MKWLLVAILLAQLSSLTTCQRYHRWQPEFVECETMLNMSMAAHFCYNGTERHAPFCCYETRRPLFEGHHHESPTDHEEPTFCCTREEFEIEQGPLIHFTMVLIWLLVVVYILLAIAAGVLIWVSKKTKKRLAKQEASFERYRASEVEPEVEGEKSGDEYELVECVSNGLN